MNLQEQILQLRSLKTLLEEKENELTIIKEIQDDFDTDLEEAKQKNLPQPPTYPQCPKEFYEIPKEIEPEGGSPVALLLGPIGWGLNAAANKEKKRIQEMNAKIDRENAINRALYEKQMKQYEEDVRNYEYRLKQYTEDKTKVMNINIDLFMKRNAHRITERKNHEEKVKQLDIKIKESTILSNNDKNLELVRFVLDKLESSRADSLMMALNLYDDHKRKEYEFETRLKIDSDNRRWQMEQQRFENELRKREENERRMNQWAYEREMRDIQRDRLREEKRQADELEQIRKMAEKY